MTNANFSLSVKRPLIMGIVNVTPDSFSGDGLMTQGDFTGTAVALAEKMLEEGADILDIGGESSRPGAVPISTEEEIRRAVPVITAIRKQLGPDCVISIDTVKANVAAAALNAGVNIINDISAMRSDHEMASVAAKHGCPIILMHNRGNAEAVRRDTTIGGQYEAAAYGDIIEEVRRDLADRAEAAQRAGIARDKIILDPGLGFGKTVAQNLALIRHLDRLKALGYPVLVGPSRKSFIGQLLNKPVGERLEGTAALVAIAAFLGADIIRVHDVGFMTRVATAATTLASS
jgi:dihydropteroate synthase